MRYLPGVLDEILEEIPADWELLRIDLTALQARARTVSPEAIHHLWAMASMILTAHTFNLNPKTEWAKRVQMIFNEPWRN